MFCGKEIAERRRVMRKWVRGSEDDDEEDVAGVVARDRHWAFAEDAARERRAAESIVGNDERRALVAVQHSEERSSRTHVTYACVPALNFEVACRVERVTVACNSLVASVSGLSLCSLALLSHTRWLLLLCSLALALSVYPASPPLTRYSQHDTCDTLPLASNHPGPCPSGE